MDARRVDMILHEMETADRTHIEKQQLQDLQTTLVSMYEHVPFYRSRFQELNLTPQNFQLLQDIQKFPFTTKKDLHRNYPFGLMAVKSNELARIHASSGTSGKPTIVGYTKKDIHNWAKLVARAITIAGGQPGDILQNAYGYGLFTGGLGLHHGAEELGVTVIPISGGNTDRQITILEDLQPTILSATPSYALNIAERMIELGKDPRKSSIKIGMFGAEPWSEEMRRALEELYAIKACDIYGLSEVLGPGVAMECCEGQDGLHLAEDQFLIEVIDPETLQPLPEGKAGELVFTSLKKQALPIIRYRTGDIASLTTEKCKCGRTTARMSRVKGRIDDMMIVRGVNVFPSEIEHHLIQVKDIAPHYQVYLKKRATLDEVELHAEITEELYTLTDCDLLNPLIKALEMEIQEIMKSQCLVSMRIVLHPPKSLPRSEGKAVRIVDQRKQFLKA
jgi:phenylacetate-CoA ligase